MIVVSRHRGTIEYVKMFFPDAEVIEHLTDVNDIPRGSIVIGNLPITLINRILERGCRFIYVSLNIPKEMRGRELSIEELDKYIEFIEIKRLELEKTDLSYIKR